MSCSLVHIDDGQPGISRRRSGRGWCYFDADGTRIRDRGEIDRLNAIALPPAYADAWFCPRPDGHILAYGTDDKGRRQYRYHPDFVAANDERKFGQLIAFGKALPRLRRQVGRDLGSRGLGHDRVTAAVIRLLDLAAIRVGNEYYARTNNSYGATTLRQRHADVKGKTLHILFPAKSGKEREVEVSDAILARIVRRLGDLPGQQLFQYLDEGERHPVTSSDVNRYIQEAMGDSFTAKTFRTWAASVMAFECLASASEDVGLKALAREVGAFLGNTAAIAQSSYIHPALLDLARGRQDRWRKSLKLPRRTKYLDRYERGLLAWLGRQVAS